MMVKDRHLAQGAALVLILVGTVCIAGRMTARKSFRLGRGETVWRITYDVVARNVPAGTRFRAALVNGNAHARVARESFSYPGLSMDIVRAGETGQREAVAASVTSAPLARFCAEFDVLVVSNGQSIARVAEPVLTAAGRARYLRAEPSVQLDRSPVRAVLAELSAASTTRGELLDTIFEYCAENLGRRPYEAHADAAGALEAGFASTIGRARAMVALCRAGRIPARLVTGFAVEFEGRLQPHVWVEAYDRQGWVPFDPDRGFARELPAHYLPARRDGTRIAWGPAGVECEASFAVRRLVPPPWLGTGRVGSIVDLTRLPPGMQQTLSILLLLPIGALVTALFRNVVGIQTFGTFTPALLALSFVYGDRRTGVVVFLAVLVIGLFGLSLLNRLRLLLVPRLGLVLTLVVLALTLAVSVLDHLGLTPSARAVILPMVILTMLIERFYTATEEDGTMPALGLLAGTVAVAFSCFLVLQWNGLGRLVLAFPEVLLFVATGFLFIGRYAGYRLTELVRFRAFAHPGGRVSCDG
jgi:transglutaminase-like putative cysteine protease